MVIISKSIQYNSIYSLFLKNQNLFILNLFIQNSKIIYQYTF